MHLSCQRVHSDIYYILIKDENLSHMLDLELFMLCPTACIA